MEIEQVDDRLKEEFERKTGENWVVVSNALNRAAHGLTMPEKRVMWLAVSKLDSRTTLNVYNPVSQIWTKRETPKIHIDAHELAELFDIDPKSAYRELNKGARELMKRVISFQRRHTKTGEPIDVQLAWVVRAEYHKTQGRVTLEFYDKILPHVWFQRKNFTRIQLQQVAKLRTKHAWKLEALFSQVAGKENSGVLHISVAEFAHAVEATEKQKEDFNNIRRRIIEPAVKELQDKNNWIIKWQPKKRGRKVHALEFKFAKDPQHRMF